MDTFIRVAVPEAVTLRTKELLSGLGIEAKFVDDLAEVTARDILATYAGCAGVDDSERFAPGDRFITIGTDPGRKGIVVRLERNLRVNTTVCVVLDGEDKVMSFGASVMQLIEDALPEDEEILDDIPPLRQENEELNEDMVYRALRATPSTATAQSQHAAAGALFAMLRSRPYSAPRLNERQVCNFVEVMVGLPCITGAQAAAVLALVYGKEVQS